MSVTGLPATRQQQIDKRGGKERMREGERTRGGKDRREGEESRTCHTDSAVPGAVLSPQLIHQAVTM
jgi:hypothetical protein